jgi:hypothetical protein
MAQVQQEQEQGGRKATPEELDTMARIDVNAKRLISGKHSNKIEAMLKQEDVVDGLGKAIAFMLQAITKGLMDKGVEVTTPMIVSENGAASIIGLRLLELMASMRIDVTKDQLDKAVELGIGNFGVKQGEEAPQREQPPQQGQPPQGQPPQGQPPQGQPPQGMPPQGMPPQGMPPQGAPQQASPQQLQGLLQRGMPQ